MPLGPLQIVMSLLYGLFTAVLLWMQARKLVVYVEASHATHSHACMTWSLNRGLSSSILHMRGPSHSFAVRSAASYIQCLPRT